MRREFIVITVKELLCPRPRGEGGILNCARLSVRLSVCPSVACLDITGEQKGLGSRNLAGWKPITRVISEPILRSKGQRSRSPGRLMLTQ